MKMKPGMIAAQIQAFPRAGIKAARVTAVRRPWQPGKSFKGDAV